MRILLLIIFIMTPNAFAQKRLTPDSFRINVRPYLSGILSDYYQMISLFPEFPKELIPVVREIDALTNEKELMRENCPRLLNEKCAEQVQNLRSKLLRSKELNLVLMSRTKMSSSLYFNTLTGIKLINQLDITLEEVKGELDNAGLLLSAKINERRETHAVIKKLDELSTLVSLALVEFIPFLYREDFRHFYFNFVHPVQQQISKNINYEFLNRNVDSLNFSINLLNMNLTKRNKKTPEGMAPYLSIIHNRWNNILRYYY